MGVDWGSRRAIGLHLLLLIAVPGCLVAGWWQLHQALRGNGLSWAYTVEWPIFAVLAAVGWWQLIHERADERAARAEQARRDLEAAAAAGLGAADDPARQDERIAAAAAREYAAHLLRQSADQGR